MGAMASQITTLTIVYSDQIKHQSYASMAFVRRIHRWPVNSPHKCPVTRKMFPFDDVIMYNGISLRAANIGKRLHMFHIKLYWVYLIHLNIFICGRGNDWYLLHMQNYFVIGHLTYQNLLRKQSFLQWYLMYFCYTDNKIICARISFKSFLGAQTLLAPIKWCFFIFVTLFRANVRVRDGEWWYIHTDKLSKWHFRGHVWWCPGSSFHIRTVFPGINAVIINNRWSWGNIFTLEQSLYPFGAGAFLRA